MRHLLLLILAIIPLTTRAIPSDRDIEKKVEKKLKSMSLEQKVGQMCQITLSLLKDRKAKTFEYNPKMVDSALRNYYVGSVLNTPGIAQTPEQWRKVIEPLQKISMEAMGTPCIYGLDQIHGASYTMGATLFPQGINMAASFDRELMRSSSEISAYETRASNVAWVFAPTMDLGRDQRWARLWESYGEDPLLNAEMGAASIRGFQGDDPNNIGMYNVAACPKHYLGYGVPTTGKDRTPAIIAPNDLREKFFAPFKKAIETGALTIMVNSGSVNGVPLHANHELITEWLKEDLEWDGMVVSDWADINNLYSRDRVASSKKEAIKIAINAGIDMSMVPSELSFCRMLKELVEEKEVSIKRIDDAVRRILRLKYRLGLFEKPIWESSDYPKFASKEFADVALRSAEESQVLLKNEKNTLPIKSGSKILVTGPSANSMRPLNGGWSYTWQGEQTDKYTAQYNTIYEALCRVYGSSNVTYTPTVEYDKSPKATYDKEITHGFEAVRESANEADYIIACIGENSYCETPGNLTDLNLSILQRDMVRELSKYNKPIVLIINGGRPRLIGDIEPLADGVIEGMLPGNYGGDAVANLISGRANFCAKLPFTYPRLINSLSTYDFKPSESRKRMQGDYNYDAKIDTQWEFGHGLSYTKYEYSNLRVSKNSFAAGDEIEVCVDVRNVGERDGKECVLLYSTDLYASVTPDNKRLRGFDKLSLKAGESRTVRFNLTARDLAFVGYDEQWRIEAGEYLLMCGSERVTIDCTTEHIFK